MKVMLCAALMLAGLVSVFAQAKPIEQAEFDAIRPADMNPDVRWEGQRYRATIVSEEHASDKPDEKYSSKMVSEHAPGGSSRIVHEWKYGDRPAGKREMVTVGDIIYQRGGDGVWTKTPVDRPTSPSPPPPGPPAPKRRGTVSTRTEYKFHGTEMLKENSVRVYSRTILEKTVDVPDGADSELKRVTRYWVQNDGVVVKSENRSENKRYGKTVHRIVTAEWELDPAISISAPEGVQ